MSDLNTIRQRARFGYCPNWSSFVGGFPNNFAGNAASEMLPALRRAQEDVRELLRLLDDKGAGA